MINIRLGRPEDHEAISRFTTDTFTWGDYVASAYPSLLEQPDSAALVAVGDDDRPLAFAHVRLLSPREGWLAAARVAPAYRRQGIGSQLNRAATAWLRERGAQVARLTTDEDNVAARQQVTKLGYRPVARFIYGERTFAHHGPSANGGQRLPAPERFDLAPSAEAEPAFVVFSHGELARRSHGLYAVGGWALRTLGYEDLVGAARRRQLWSSPSGWAVAEVEGGEAWVDLLVTTPDDAATATRALIDLAEEQQWKSMELIVPRLGWLEAALKAEHIQLGHATVAFQLALI